VQQNGTTIMLLPGPPSELKAMFAEQCLSRLQRICRPEIRTRFYPALLECRIGSRPVDRSRLYEVSESGHYGSSQRREIFRFICGARCDTGDEAEALLAEVGTAIEHLLGDRLYSRNGDSLETVVGRMLAAEMRT